MKITYIHHSSFFVELEQVCLLFDYTEGALPAPVPGKPLLVFASHRHGDHFSKEIWKLADTWETVHFVLSFDISRRQAPEALADRICWLRAGQTVSLEAGNTKITAFRSTDEGVAFLVRTCGHTLYHAGDLNDWRWNGESKAWNNNMHANYMRELTQITASGIRPEVAFLPLDGRLEEWFYLGLHEFMECVGADCIFPMHCWGDFSVIERLKSMELSAPYRTKLADIHTDGQTFSITGK